MPRQGPEDAPEKHATSWLVLRAREQGPRTPGAGDEIPGGVAGEALLSVRRISQSVDVARQCGESFEL